MTKAYDPSVTVWTLLILQCHTTDSNDPTVSHYGYYWPHSVALWTLLTPQCYITDATKPTVSHLVTTDLTVSCLYTTDLTVSQLDTTELTVSHYWPHISFILWTLLTPQCHTWTNLTPQCNTLITSDPTVSHLDATDPTVSDWFRYWTLLTPLIALSWAKNTVLH